jgi:hypothetical protein
MRNVWAQRAIEPRPEILTGLEPRPEIPETHLREASTGNPDIVRISTNSLGDQSCTRVTFPVSDVLPQNVENITQPDEPKIC